MGFINNEFNNNTNCFPTDMLPIGRNLINNFKSSTYNYKISIDPKTLKFIAIFLIERSSWSISSVLIPQVVLCISNFEFF